MRQTAASFPVSLTVEVELAIRYTSQLFNYKDSISKMPLCTFFPYAHSFKTPLKEGIKSLFRVVFKEFPMMSNKGLQLSKEHLNQI